MKNSPDLSICIPTFNRCALLKGLLQSIVAAVEFACASDSVEVVISDNHSTDLTREVAKTFEAKLQINYIFQDSPILPGDRNFHFVASQGRARYLWVIGDDDQLREDAILTVLNCLRKGVDLCVCNYSLLSPDFKSVLKPYDFRKSIPLVLADHHDMMRCFGSKLSLISITIMRREIFETVSYSDYMIFVDDGLAFLFMVYIVALQSRSIRFVAEPIVQYRCGNNVFSANRWRDVFIIGISKVLKVLEERGYTRADIIHAKTKTVTDYFIREIISRKAKGESLRIYRKAIVECYSDSPLFWVYCFPLFFIPHPPFSLIRILYQWARTIVSMNHRIV